MRQIENCKIAYFNTTISIITFNIYGVNIPLKRQKSLD